MTAVIPRVREASHSLKLFGQGIGMLDRTLDGAERECKKRDYDMMFVLINSASQILNRMHQEIGCINDNPTRRESYHILETHAQDIFASHTRRILNMYCNARQVK